MRAKVDKDLCIGCGLCEGLCPKVFRLNDDCKAEAIERELTDEELRDAEDARSQCPAEAITVEK